MIEQKKLYEIKVQVIEIVKRGMVTKASACECHSKDFDDTFLRNDIFEIHWNFHNFEDFALQLISTKYEMEAFFDKNNADAKDKFYSFLLGIYEVRETNNSLKIGLLEKKSYIKNDLKMKCFE